MKLTIGCDLGDRFSEICVLDIDGNVVTRQRVRTTPAAFDRFFAQGVARVIIEAGTHSRWVEDVATKHGHEVFVANPRQVRLIYAGRNKSDQLDALALARLGRYDTTLLAPIKHRGRAKQADLAVLRARQALVEARTKLVNHVRGVVKSFGLRAPGCTTEAFPKHARELLMQEPALVAALAPVLDSLDALTQKVRDYDRVVESTAKASYPAVAQLSQVTGVGPQTGLWFVLAIDDPKRFANGRKLSAYLGLCPRRVQSGNSDPETRISKSGNPDLRRLLVNCAHYILGPFGKDCDLRRHGLRLAASGGKRGKKRAVVAVARKLSVLLHRLWVSGAEYQPLRAAA